MPNTMTAQRTFNLDHIFINLKMESNGLRLTTEDKNWLVPNQTLEETQSILEENYKIIKDHFQRRTGTLIRNDDLENVCLNIALHYFQMYNQWRTLYEREAKRDLTFIQEDFDHPGTSSCIVDYFKKTYPDNYADKCEIMLGMTQEQFKDYVFRKEQFDNR